MATTKTTTGLPEGAAPIALNNQTVGNVGLYYVCYQLSRRGWNVMPTARNARGVDLVIYSQDAAKQATVQVKALSKRNPVPLGSKLDHLFAGYFVVCRNVAKEPECFVMLPEEVRERAHRGTNAEGQVSFWLQPADYEAAEFREAWHRIGA